MWALLLQKCINPMILIVRLVFQALMRWVGSQPSWWTRQGNDAEHVITGLSPVTC